jgi:CheY-like chemotaxis protein
VLKNQGQNRVDFVLLDLNMPIMGGIECCEALRKHFNEKKYDANESLNEKEKLMGENLEYMLDEEWNHFFIFAASAHVDKTTEKQCFDAGFDRVMEAPISVEIAKNLIKLPILEFQTRRESCLQKIKSLDNQESPIR